MPPRIDHGVRLGLDVPRIASGIDVLEKTEREIRFRQKLERNLTRIYGAERAPHIFDRVHQMMEQARGYIPERPPKPEGQGLTQDAIALIGFPHQLQRGAAPIQN